MMFLLLHDLQSRGEMWPDWIAYVNIYSQIRSCNIL